MVKAKKIISKIISGGFEVVKDSAKQIGEIGASIPDKLAETVVGTTTPPKKDELGKYLENLAPYTSEEELKKRQEELSQKDQEELEETRKGLKKVTTPLHMRLSPKPLAPRPQEKMIAEEEQRRAQAEEEEKKQPKSIVTPKSVSKQPRLPWVGRKTKGIEGWVKDTKIG